MLSQESLELIARACHEANRAICEMEYDDMPSWDDAEPWQREAAVNGVKYVLDNPTITPEQMHDEWVKNKTDDGWVYGTIKDVEKRTHPSLVDYDELTEYGRLKDSIFNAIVKSFIKHK